MWQIQWQDRFNIGVERIDQAHRELFSIVQKILELYVERHKSKFACMEGIKYFKAYALKHFAEEEAYMREIGYPDYLIHKRIHDRMRKETLPALERELNGTDFSTEAVQHFIGVCIGWLTGHIIMEDRAITGRAAGELSPPPEDEAGLVRTLILDPLREMFGPDIQFAGRCSADHRIRDAYYYALTYGKPAGPKLRLVLMIGEPLLLRAAGLMFGIDFFEMNEIVRFAIREIVQNLLQRAEVRFGEHADAYQLEEDRLLEAEEFRQGCGEHLPQYSLLFTARKESFVLCMDRIAESAAPAD